MLAPTVNLQNAFELRETSSCQMRNQLYHFMYLHSFSSEENKLFYCDQQLSSFHFCLLLCFCEGEDGSKQSKAGRNNTGKKRWVADFCESRARLPYGKPSRVAPQSGRPRVKEQARLQQLLSISN